MTLSLTSTDRGVVCGSTCNLWSMRLRSIVDLEGAAYHHSSYTDFSLSSDSEDQFGVIFRNLFFHRICALNYFTSCQNWLFGVKTITARHFICFFKQFCLVSKKILKLHYVALNIFSQSRDRAMPTTPFRTTTRPRSSLTSTPLQRLRSCVAKVLCPTKTFYHHQ